MKVLWPFETRCPIGRSPLPPFPTYLHLPSDSCSALTWSSSALRGEAPPTLLLTSLTSSP